MVPPDTERNTHNLYHASGQVTVHARKLIDTKRGFARIINDANAAWVTQRLAVVPDAVLCSI